MITQIGNTYTLTYWCNRLNSIQSFIFIPSDICWIDIDKRQCYNNTTNVIAFDIPEQAFDEFINLVQSHLTKFNNYLINVSKIIYIIEGHSHVSDSISNSGWVKIPYYEINFAGAYGRLSIPRNTYNEIISVLGLTTKAES